MARVRRRRSSCWYLLLVVTGLALAVARPLDAASFALTPGERDEAIRMGRRSVVSEDFGAEWRVAGETPGQALTVMTPFHRLALAARNSAFKNEELRQKDVDSLLKDQEGKLVLWATFRGPRADFARFYAPALLRGQQAIKASFTQNERTALREEDGRYTARCMYVFPADALDKQGTVTLVVKDPDDKAVGRFTVDLSAMR
jgi:hypothetical protein